MFARLSPDRKPVWDVSFSRELGQLPWCMTECLSTAKTRLLITGNRNMVSSAYWVVFFFHTMHTRSLKRLARTSAYVKRLLNVQHMLLLFRGMGWGWGWGWVGGRGGALRGEVTCFTQRGTRRRNLACFPRVRVKSARARAGAFRRSCRLLSMTNPRALRRKKTKWEKGAQLPEAMGNNGRNRRKERKHESASFEAF